MPASVIGNYLSMFLWILGFKYALASRAAILNQTHTIFLLILATLLLSIAAMISPSARTTTKLIAPTLRLANHMDHSL